MSNKNQKIKRTKDDYFCSISMSTKHKEKVSEDVNIDDMNEIYSYSFKHHILNAPQDLKSSEFDAELTKEYVAWLFHTKFYSTKLYKGISGTTSIDIRKFFVEFIHSPITKSSESESSLGENKMIALIGKVGTGKSTFLSNLMIKYQNEIDKNNLLVHRVDIEEFAGRDVNKILFFKQFYIKLTKVILDKDHANREYWEEVIYAFNPPLGGDSDIQANYYLLAIKHLIVSLYKKTNKRCLFLLDNVDKYYYLFDRSSFSEEGEGDRSQGMEKLYSILGEFISQNGTLDGCGLCVITAMRKHTYEFLKSNRHVSPNAAFIFHSVLNDSVFRLEKLPAKAVIDARIKLIKELINLTLVPPDKSIAIKQIESIGHIWNGVLDPKSEIHGANRTMIDDLEMFMHHGHRSLIDHLGLYKWALSGGSEFTRIFRSYSPAILLFMLNNKQRYSQAESRFPNLFLIRGEVNTGAEGIVPDRLIRPHKHTYWLKYFLLKFIQSNKSQNFVVNKENIFNVFCRGKEKNGFYEKHIVELLLGSLCQVDSSYCIEPLFGGTSLDGNSTASTIQDIEMTPRGDVLLDRFCFGFSYLQLVVEDYMLQIPKGEHVDNIEKLFVIDNEQNYDYLVADRLSYADKALSMVNYKVKVVSRFLTIIEAALEIEKIRREPVFQILDSQGVKLPDFSLIKSDLQNSIRKILNSFNDSKALQESAKLEFEQAEFEKDKLIVFFREAYLHSNI